MKTQVSELADNRVRLDVEVPAGDVDHAFDHALFIFLRVTDPGTGRRWLGQLAEGDQITTAVRLEDQFDNVETAVTANIAFTHEGLRALGAPERVLRAFPIDYRQGMGARTRNSYLGSALAFGNWAVETGRLLGNPFDRIPKADKKADPPPSTPGDDGR